MKVLISNPKKETLKIEIGNMSCRGVQTGDNAGVITSITTMTLTIEKDSLYVENLEGANAEICLRCGKTFKCSLDTHHCYFCHPERK